MYAVIVNKRAVVYEGKSAEDIGVIPYFVSPCIVRMETCWGRGIDDRLLDLSDTDDRLLNQQVDLARLLRGAPGHRRRRPAAAPAPPPAAAP
jgi:hypothetical protein